jgi:hypothetical protein
MTLLASTTKRTLGLTYRFIYLYKYLEKKNSHTNGKFNGISHIHLRADVVIIDSMGSKSHQQQYSFD